MGFGCYGVKSGHTESFIAGDRERPKAAHAETTKNHPKVAISFINIEIKKRRLLCEL